MNDKPGNIRSFAFAKAIPKERFQNFHGFYCAVKKSAIIFLTTTPTVGGNGDALIFAAMEAAKEQGAKPAMGVRKPASVYRRMILWTSCGWPMKRHVRNILTLPSVSRAISEYRTEVIYPVRF